MMVWVRSLAVMPVGVGAWNWSTGRGAWCLTFLYVSVTLVGSSLAIELRAPIGSPFKPRRRVSSGTAGWVAASTTL